LSTVERRSPERDLVPDPAEPVRTCVGCRSRAAKTDLVRVVLVEGQLALDLRGRLPGRGASLHPDPDCLDLAERRRAFARALRTTGPLDLTAVRRYVEAQRDQQ
jgi:predicted RNA-binding protein YlxR (DUF448 family)